MFLFLTCAMLMVDARPQTQTSFSSAQAPGTDLGTDISNLANGARQTASLFEEGGSTGLDIVNQFQQLFGRNYIGIITLWMI